MNGHSDPNFNEAGTPGTSAGASGEYASSSAYGAGQPAGTYSTEGNYTASGSAYPGTGAGPAADAYAPGYVPPPPGYAPYGAPVPPLPVPGAPNPGLATLLGFIPGVGAMYNGQFAKGIAHIVIFSILTSLSSHMGDPLDVLFGLLVAGWYFYMIFDAYQTARARRDGLIVPDPFGLNNIGERFGITSSPNWGDFVARPAPGSTPSAATDSARVSNPYAGPAYTSQYGAPYASPVDPVTGAPVSGAAAPGYGAPPAGYSAVPPAGYGSVPPVGSAYVPPTQYPGSVPPAWQPGYVDPAAAYPGSSPYATAYVPNDPAVMPPVKPSSGIPVGAFWLIGLGVLALVGSIGHNMYWTGRYFGGLVPILFGIFLIVQRALAAKNFYPEGSASYTWYIFHGARTGVLLIVVGVLTLLSSVHVLAWSHSWPYLLILFGLMQVADRAAYNRMLAEAPVPPMPLYGTPAAGTSSAQQQQEEAESKTSNSNSGFTSIFGQEGR